MPRRGAKSRPRAAKVLQRGDHVRTNLRLWESIAREYETLHADSLRGGAAMAWGVWRIPESSLRLLGPVKGRRTLELGCGAADWSIALGRRGARVTGLDFSPQRLSQAAKNASRQRALVPLVRATAESLPFADRTFDIVFCDWGAMTFADPRKTVPEAARVLADGGRLVFSTDSPLHVICLDVRRDRNTQRLRRDYFGLHRIEYPGEVNFQLTFGEWIALFRRNRLAIEQLVETQPAPGARSTYRTAEDAAWSRRWPAESIWRLRREPEGADRPQKRFASTAKRARRLR